jgi:hypothetical protein
MLINKNATPDGVAFLFIILYSDLNHLSGFNKS